MSKSIPEQLRFPPVDGMTVRADFEGGTLSSDFGPMLLRGIDHQIGLTPCLAQAFDDQRHPRPTPIILCAPANAPQGRRTP